MSKGYVYCLSSESMNKIVKVGMTERTPDVRAKELSASSGVPTPFKVEFAKLVSDPKKKEITLHKLLSQYTLQINPKREFFRVSPEEVMTLFDLMEGTMWEDKTLLKDDDVEEEEEEVEEEVEVEVNGALISNSKKGRDISKYFTNRQQIRHTIGINKTWIGNYDSSHNVIVYDGKFYKSLSGFVNTHHRQNGTYKNHGVSGWICTECEVDGQWVSTFNLQAF
jgi:hypothetical protein